MGRLLEELKSSERHACELMAVPRSSGRYRSRRDDSQIQERLRELAREHPRFGYRRLPLYLHKEMGANHKKVQRMFALSLRYVLRCASPLAYCGHHSQTPFHSKPEKLIPTD